MKQTMNRLATGTAWSLVILAGITLGLPHPSKQTFSSGALSLTLATEISGSTVYSLNVDVPM